MQDMPALGLLTLCLANAGVPEGATAGTLCATYNNLDSVRALFKANPGEIAGVMLEPVVGNSGYIEPTQEFLEGLRTICTEVVIELIKCWPHRLRHVFL